MSDSGERDLAAFDWKAPWPQPRLRDNRATHGPQDQAGRGNQRLFEAANIVAVQGITVG